MTNHRTLTIGDTIELVDGEYNIVGFGGGIFRLRNDVTGEYLLVGHLELARYLPPATTLPTPTQKAETTVAAALDGLDDDTLALIPHLRELTDGTPIDAGDPRPEFAETLPMNTRLARKLHELRQLGIDMSESTLKRKLRRFREAGPAGLADGRGTRMEAPLARADADIKAMLGELLADYQDKSTPSTTRIRAELRYRLVERFPERSARPAMPSLSTVQRYIRVLDGDRKTTGSARQRQTKSKTPNGRHSARLASAPGDECQVDTTRFDTFVRLPDGSVKRPWLTILVCKRTRSLLAFNFTATAPTGHDHSVLVARALVPRKLRPWAARYKEMKLPEMPWAAHLSASEQEKYDTHRPYIIPQRILTDNGTDYTSNVLRSTCSRHGISLTESPYVSPTSKAQVERMFGTIGSKFAQFLPGYAGSRTEFRGAEPENEAVLDLGTLTDLFDRWVAIVWQNRIHDGLIDPYQPSVRHSPNTMYAASLDLAGHFTIALEPDEYLMLMPKETRTVQADGIEFRGRRYDSPHLAPLRDHHRSDGSKTKFDVHYDPSDIHQVWVRSPYDNDWVTCSWTEADGLSRPLEKEYLDSARRLSAMHGGFTNDESDQLTLELRDEAIEHAAQLERLRREAAESTQRAAEKEDVASKASSVGRTFVADDGEAVTDFPRLKAI